MHLRVPAPRTPDHDRAMTAEEAIETYRVWHERVIRGRETIAPVVEELHATVRPDAGVSQSV